MSQADTPSREGDQLKTLLAHLLARKYVALPGFDEPVWLPVDHIFGHDRNTFKIVDELARVGESEIASCRFSSRLRLFMDHYSPPPSENEAKLHAQQRLIGKACSCSLHDVGTGVGHQLALENYVTVGDVVLSIDSHVCTVGALGALGIRQPPNVVANALRTGEFRFDMPHLMRIELTGRLDSTCCAKDVALTLACLGEERFQDKFIEFGGSGLQSLSMDARFTLANLTVDLHARGGLVEVDSLTFAYLKSVGRDTPCCPMKAEASDYTDVITFDLSSVKPMVAAPPTIFSATHASELQGLPVTAVAIGSCTNGRVSDFEEFLAALDGRPCAAGVRVIATPASRSVFMNLLQRGLLQELTERGVTINPPGCGPCMGLHQGALSPGDVCLATGSKNHPGRMGAKDASVYLCGAPVAGASAREGTLTVP